MLEKLRGYSVHSVREKGRLTLVTRARQPKRPWRYATWDYVRAIHTDSSTEDAIAMHRRGRCPDCRTTGYCAMRDDIRYARYRQREAALMYRDDYAVVIQDRDTNTIVRETGSTPMRAYERALAALRGGHHD
jgi:hypothetical protein